MGDILPQQILRRPKLGFNIPYKNWLRNELRDLLQDTLSPTHLRRQGLFHPQYVQTLIRELIAGVRDHSHKLWQLLIFQLWSERNLSSKTASAEFVKCDNKRVGGNGGELWEADPRSRVWLVG